MNFPSLNHSFFDFLREYAKENPERLRLKGSYLQKKFPEVNIPFAITQIECRKKAVKKMADFASVPLIVFPDVISTEQASAQEVANYHASLLNGENLLDMTAGLGIDIITISRKFKNAVALELDPLKAFILDYNIRILGISNIKVVNADSVDWLRNSDVFFSTIFIDPARRNSENKRLYRLQDCTPNVVGIFSELLMKTNKLLIKASPMLDVTQTLRELPQTEVLRCVSLNGECKEILVECCAQAKLKSIEAIGLNNDGSKNFEFRFNPNIETTTKFYDRESPITDLWLYEPDASIMKLACWGPLCSHFPGLTKLSTVSHIFVAKELFNNFPGRKLKIISVPDKNDLKSLKDSPINVVSRGHPESTEIIRRKFRLKEGNDLFLYALKIGEKPTYIVARR